MYKNTYIHISVLFIQIRRGLEKPRGIVKFPEAEDTDIYTYVHFVDFPLGMGKELHKVLKELNPYCGWGQLTKNIFS